MKTFYALLIAALFSTAACSNKKGEPAKTETAKTTEPAKTTETAKTEPTQTEPAKTEPTPTEPAKTETAKTEPTAGPIDQAGAKAVELADKVVKAAADAGDDCAKLGAALKPLADEAKAVVAKTKEIEKGDAAKKTEYETRYAKPAREKLKDPMAKADKCRANADVKAFLDATK